MKDKQILSRLDRAFPGWRGRMSEREAVAAFREGQREERERILSIQSLADELEVGAAGERIIGECVHEPGVTREDAALRILAAQASPRLMSSTPKA